MRESMSYIKEYLDIASKYSKIFFEDYKKMNYKEEWDLQFYPHWNGIRIMDKKNETDIDFDYFKYNGKKIKYFDPWKLNLYTKNNYDFTFSTGLILKLEEEGKIKKHFKSSYYYII